METLDPPQAATASRDLVLTRLMSVSSDKLFRCWSEPDLLRQWFAPHPWIVALAEIDMRPGGGMTIAMRGPEGQESPVNGVFLEIVENRKIVFTDAYTTGWTPSEKPFFTAIITFEEMTGEEMTGEDEAVQTRYTATARHFTAEDCAMHEKMGFHEGWGQCAAQLEALAGTL